MKRYSVSLIVFHKDKKILLQNREQISRVGEEWGFFGGEIEKGETPEEAAVREIKEELEFDLKEFRFFKRYDIDIGIISITAYVFLSELGSVKDFNQQEGHDMQLFTIDDALKLKTVEGDKIIFNELREAL